MKITQFTFNPDGDSYDVVFIDQKKFIEGDYYHEKISEQLQGMKGLLDLQGQKYTHKVFHCKVKKGEDWEFDLDTIQPDIDEQLDSYQKRIEKKYHVNPFTR